MTGFLLEIKPYLILRDYILRIIGSYLILQVVSRKPR